MVQCLTDFDPIDDIRAARSCLTCSLRCLFVRELTMATAMESRRVDSPVGALILAYDRTLGSDGLATTAIS